MWHGSTPMRARRSTRPPPVLSVAAGQRACTWGGARLRSPPLPPMPFSRPGGGGGCAGSAHLRRRSSSTTPRRRRRPPRRSGRWPCRPRRAPRSVLGSPMASSLPCPTRILRATVSQSLPLRLPQPPPLVAATNLSGLRPQERTGPQGLTLGREKNTKNKKNARAKVAKTHRSNSLQILCYAPVLGGFAPREVLCLFSRGLMNSSPALVAPLRRQAGRSLRGIAGDPWGSRRAAAVGPLPCALLGTPRCVCARREDRADNLGAAAERAPTKKRSCGPWRPAAPAHPAGDPSALRHPHLSP
jgi:hypothetical protein